MLWITGNLFKKSTRSSKGGWAFTSMSDLIKLHLLKRGGREFFRLMSERKIPGQLNRHDPGTVMAAGEIIAIVKVVGGLSILPSITAIIVQWLKIRSSRKIMVPTKDQVMAGP
jgi:hypothetical protein